MRFRKIKHIPIKHRERRPKRVTLADVARASGVSRRCAMDFLNGHTQTKTPNNMNILSTAKRLGYTCKTLVGTGVPTCPNCSNHSFKVIETRKTEEEWLRIRECKNCDSRFMTAEVIINERRYIQS